MWWFCLILGFLVVPACKQKTDTKGFPENLKKDNILEGFSFSTDTLMVDTGEDLINFGIPFLGSQSPNARFYYILNYQSLELQKIDLDSLKLIDTFRFEKDGPNGPGFTFSFQPLSGENFFFPSFQRPCIIFKSGEKTRSWNLNPNEIVDGIPVEPGSVTNRVVFNPYLDQLYSLPTNYETREYYLAILDSAGEKKEMLELPEFLKANQFTIRTGEGEGGGLKIEFPFLQHLNDKVLVSCSVGNGIYIFDLTKDSLSYREFPLKLVPLGKEGVVRNRVHSNEEFEEEIKKLATQISYWSFIWDQHSQRYFRFASRVGTHRTEYKEVKMEIFLMVFSKDLELLGETKLEGLPKVPLGSFFKDGKLWNYVNVEDDLGFAVMDFNFAK